MLTSAARPTSTGPVNTATRIESPSPALQGESVQAAMESFSESLKPNRQTNRQLEVRPELVHFKAAGPTFPRPVDASPPTEETLGSTTWPQENKWALANAAAIALTSSSMNAGKNISPTEIVHTLDKNPSYVELCQIIERRGFFIDRSHFAKQLLDAVPSLDTNKPEMQHSGPVKISNSEDLPHDRAVKGAVKGAVNGSVERAVNGIVNGAAQTPNAQSVPVPQSHSKDGVVNGYKNGGVGIRNLGRKPKDLTTNGIGPGGQTEPLIDAADRFGSNDKNPATNGIGSIGQKDPTIDPVDCSGSSHEKPTANGIGSNGRTEPTIDAGDPSGSSHIKWATPMTQSGSRRFPNQTRLNQTPGSVVTQSGSSRSPNQSRFNQTTELAVIQSRSRRSPNQSPLNQTLESAVNQSGSRLSPNQFQLNQTPEWAVIQSGSRRSPNQSRLNQTPDSAVNQSGSICSPTQSRLNQTPESAVNQSGSRHSPNQSRLNQTPESAASTPLTKKEMARKRTFSEIVDLTNVTDEEDEVPQTNKRPDVVHNKSNKKAATSSTMSASVAVADGAGAASTHPTPNQGPKKSRRRLPGSADRSGLSSSAITEDESSDLTRFNYSDSLQDLLQSAIIIRPMNKKNDALPRFKYNPKTIARDILVSAGKHLNMAPLNHHLDVLRKKFAYVDNNSDLSTFRWDLVDPGGKEKTSTELPVIDLNDGDDADLDVEIVASAARHGMQVSTTVDGEERLATTGRLFFELRNLITNISDQIPLTPSVSKKCQIAGSRGRTGKSS